MNLNPPTTKKFGGKVKIMNKNIQEFSKNLSKNSNIFQNIFYI